MNETVEILWRYAISHIETAKPDVSQAIQIVAVVPQLPVVYIDYLVVDVPQADAAEEPWLTAVAAWERMREIRGHVEDMTEYERLYMLGLLAGSLENALVALGVLARTKTGDVLGPKDFERLAEEAAKVSEA